MLRKYATDAILMQKKNVKETEWRGRDLMFLVDSYLKALRINNVMWF